MKKQFFDFARQCSQKLVLTAALTCVCGVKASAATFFVGDTQDTTNASSLRGAIIAANALGGANMIVLTNEVYPLTIQGADEDAGYLLAQQLALPLRIAFASRPPAS